MYESINIFEYLAELLNISMLNSSTFLNLVEDLIKAIETENLTSVHRKLMINVLGHTFPLFSHSLNEKISHEYKKVL